MNIDYKIAKQLKEAGFPSGDKGKYVQVLHEESDAHEKETGNKLMEIIYIPTLSELIEACGGELQNLTRFDDDVWLCNNTEKGPCCESWVEHDTEGKTPSEAVAKLYIKLNAKKPR